AFYDGSIGQALIKDIQAKGGCMSMQDLENYQAQLVEPLSFEYARGRIFSAPELTGGPTFMQALQRLVDNSPTHTALDGKAYQDLAAALAAAFDHRLRALGDHESPKAPGSTTHFSVV